MTDEQLKTLEAQYKKAQRAAVLVKTPQCKELFSIMMDDMAVYNNTITGTKALSHEDYLLNLGKIQGLRTLITRLKTLAENKEKYAEQLEKYGK